MISSWLPKLMLAKFIMHPAGIDVGDLVAVGRAVHVLVTVLVNEGVNVGVADGGPQEETNGICAQFVQSYPLFSLNVNMM
jgi:hypothetical protein